MSRPRVIIGLFACPLLVACARAPAADPARAPATSPAAPPATVSAAVPSATTSAGPSQEAALALHRAAIVVDTHNDVTQRLMVQDVDLSQRLPDGQTDLPRMRDGGLDAEFLSVFVVPMLYPKERAYQQALAQFDAIDKLVAANPDSTVLARTSSDVRNAATAGKTAFLIGVEGGHALGDASDAELLTRLGEFARRGARYMTLTWSNSNRLGGSSGDDGKTRGLTPFGKQVVAKMNDLHLLVDISHVSDASFFDAVHASKRPVLASHSSARALSDHPRNMTDDMLRAVRDNGGAVCVNFGPQFLDASWAKAEEAAHTRAAPEMQSLFAKASSDPKAAQAGMWKLFGQLAVGLPRVPASLVIDHIEHIARVAGVDHVCLGSDYDGISIAPAGLDDVSKLPFVTEELLRRGFGEGDVRKILGENVLRVLAASEQ
jgi:membrane dipeptidase